MSRLVAGGLAVVLAGCGLTQTRGPDPRRAPDQRPDCTESLDAPKRDAYGAALGFSAILVGLLFLKTDSAPDAGVGLIAGGAVVMAASYASGGIGYFRVKRCRKAIAEFERSHPAPVQSGPPGATAAPR